MQTPDIVSADEDRVFWADAHEGLVRLGTGEEVGQNIVMQVCSKSWGTDLFH